MNLAGFEAGNDRPIFLIAGTVYILNWKKYKPIVRPAILTAFFNTPTPSISTSTTSPGLIAGVLPGVPV